MITIDAESRKRKRQPYNLDNLTFTYKTESGIYIFPSPSLWVLEKNLFYLLKNSEVENFDQKYYMKPSYLSFDKYDTVSLASVLMYVNGIQCIEEFDMDTVIIPTLQSIVELCKDKINQTKVDNLEEIAW
jgi:hypothetical protein